MVDVNGNVDRRARGRPALSEEGVPPELVEKRRKQREYMREWSARNRGKTREWARKHKKEAKAKYRAYRQEHQGEIAVWRRKHYLQDISRIKRHNAMFAKVVKMISLRIYSDGTMCCARCGERDTRFLTLDHLHNDGYEHRKHSKYAHMGIWAMHNNWPPIFQVLCYNCNCSKGKRVRAETTDARKQKQQAYNTKAHAKVRTGVISHYSNGTMACKCCGAKGDDLLTVDHVNGGGERHRAVIGGGARTYWWLKNNGYPEGFQVLCWNCNCGRQHFGFCPHKI